VIKTLPSPDDPAPVVGATHGDHSVRWTVDDQWTCTCNDRRKPGELRCGHVAIVAQSLPWRVAEALVAARRRHGHLPPSAAN
jgi:hypothetical protein